MSASAVKVLGSVLHQIDVDEKCCTSISLGAATDLNEYLIGLLSDVGEDKQYREYELGRETTEFSRALVAFQKEQDLAFNPIATELAQRLLAKELDTDKKYGHLNASGKGHVKRGSFMQLLYQDEGCLAYLGVKVEHQKFLDEKDLKNKIGLSVSKKIYKACKVTYGVDGVAEKVIVHDTNTKQSVYWWNDFLELIEKRDNSFNTKTACEEVIKVVNRLKTEHPADYTILRNASIAAFKQTGAMKYSDFVEKVFENYEPVSDSLKSTLPDLVSKLNDLPDKKKFDRSFTLVPSVVPFKRSNVPLTKEITLSYDEGMQNIHDKIWQKKEGGKNLVVIEVPDAFKLFTVK